MCYCGYYIFPRESLPYIYRDRPRFIETESKRSRLGYLIVLI